MYKNNEMYNIVLIKSGGGSYDEGGFGIKVGKWIDLDEEFCDNK